MRNILRLAMAVALGCLVGCSRGNYPIKTPEEAAKSGNYSGWKLRMILGVKTGPYRAVGDEHLNAGAAGKSVTYRMNGDRQTTDLSSLRGEILLGRFENANGNNMVLVFTKSPGATSDANAAGP